MKVGDKKTRPVAQSVVNGVTGAGQTASVDAVSKAGQPDKLDKVDKVDISPEAIELTKARKLLDGVPDIRVDKVNGLKTEIENNRYTVDTEKVVVRLIERSIRDAIYTKGKP